MIVVVSVVTAVLDGIKGNLFFGLFRTVLSPEWVKFEATLYVKRHDFYMSKRGSLKIIET